MKVLGSYRMKNGFINDGPRKFLDLFLQTLFVPQIGWSGRAETLHCLMDSKSILASLLTPQVQQLLKGSWNCEPGWTVCWGSQGSHWVSPCHTDTSSAPSGQSGNPCIWQHTQMDSLYNSGKSWILWSHGKGFPIRGHSQGWTGRRELHSETNREQRKMTQHTKWWAHFFWPSGSCFLPHSNFPGFGQFLPICHCWVFLTTYTRWSCSRIWWLS